MYIDRKKKKKYIYRLVRIIARRGNVFRSEKRTNFGLSYVKQIKYPAVSCRIPTVG